MGSPQRKAKPIFPKTLEDARALGIPVITPLRTEQFEFQLRKSTDPKSELTDVARSQLHLDYMSSCNDVLRNKIARYESGTVGPRPFGKGRLEYNAKQLAEHYQVSRETVRCIIKLGNEQPSTAAKPRTGRKKKLTPGKAS